MMVLAGDYSKKRTLITMGRPSKNPITTISINGVDSLVIERVVKANGTSGGVYLPKEWIGKTVTCIVKPDIII